jgi:hypothetical protein
VNSSHRVIIYRTIAKTIQDQSDNFVEDFNFQGQC